MSDKLFNFLSNYYTLSKKYAPLAFLAIVLILSFTLKNFAITLCVYFGLCVLHLTTLLIIKTLLRKEIEKSLMDEDFKNSLINLNDDEDNQNVENEE